ncbi:MAG: cell division protein ZapE [Magnetococcales bacterium]|nr:cell division protein ZapE [Magnetococcales bacterium]NGZ26058.1 cell division protein ZapE [Magnetococcales bacterium]
MNNRSCSNVLPANEGGAGITLCKPSQRWAEAVRHGRLQHDIRQEGMLPLLDQVAEELNQPVQRIAWRGVDVWRLESGDPPPHGVYLYGDVGRGKSLLMQMIFDSVSIHEKRRVHFHPFMEELHHRLFHAKPPKNVDLMLYMASEISAQARLLCFDEFYITTIADGVLLGRLLEALFKCGVTVFATSNWAPDDLFQDGFNRGRVLPFIELMKKHVHVCELGLGVDWRRQNGTTNSQVLPPADHLFSRLAGCPPTPTSILLRHTPVPAHGMENGVFWFGFEELCSRMLGRAEYMNLCGQAKSVIISGLPRLTADGADAAMRFIVLVDLLYEHRVPLQVYSHVDLAEACLDGPAAFAWRRSVSRVHELSRYTA